MVTTVNKLLSPLSVNMRRIPESGQKYELGRELTSWDPLAEEIGVQKIEQFVAFLNVSPWKQDGARIEGELKLRCQQECAISGEPVETSLVHEFTRHFLPDRASNRRSQEIVEGEWVLNPDDDDPPDLISGGTIDLWPVVIEEIVLNLDPFPRKDGAAVSDSQHAETGSETTGSSHFSELKALITEKKSKN